MLYLNVNSTGVLQLKILLSGIYIYIYMYAAHIYIYIYIYIWTPVFLPGEFHGQRSLAGYSPWCCKKVRHNWVTNTIHLFLKEHWSGLPFLFPGDLPDAGIRIEPRFPALQADSLLSEPSGKHTNMCVCVCIYIHIFVASCLCICVYLPNLILSNIIVFL